MFLLVFWNLRKYNLLQVWIRTKFCTGMGLLTVNKNKLCRSRNITENAKKKYSRMAASKFKYLLIRVPRKQTIVKVHNNKASGLIILTNNLFLDILAKKSNLCPHLLNNNT